MKPLCVFVLMAGVSYAQQAPPPSPTLDPEFRKVAEEWEKKMNRGEGKLQPGDPAPDFRLKRLNSDKSVRLSEFTDKKPVALVFGSYT